MPGVPAAGGGSAPHPASARANSNGSSVDVFGYRVVMDCLLNNPPIVRAFAWRCENDAPKGAT